MRFAVYLSILFFSFNAAYAASNVSCAPAVVKVDNKNIILPGPDEAKTTQIYFFNNISNKSLWIDHPVDHPSASAGWSSYMRPGNWSAIAINRKNFKISCAVIEPGSVNYQDCAKAIAICSPKNSPKQAAKTSSKQKGTSGWMVEDKSLVEFDAVLAKKGF